MRYTADLESIRKHTVPEWYDDAKFGIFIHWGPYSVPAFAPPTWALGDVPADENWFVNNPYAEWYLNSIRIGRGPAWEHHVQTYGANFPYENFTHLWKAEAWDARQWAGLFADIGAKYVIPTTKHHDGFCLWDSDYTEYNTKRRGPMRDIVDDLSRAVREAGMRFGVYYSGVIDWRFVHEPVLSGWEVNHPYNISYAYSDYAYNQMIELIDKYEPSILWNDIGWPEKGLVDLPYLLAHYYNSVPEGVVNDRYSGVWHDFSTREYNLGEKKLTEKWECCRGLGLSFGYNQVEDDHHLIAPNDLIKLLIDTVALGGNLLLNVGPKADGTIPDNQRERLLHLGQWLKRNGEAIYGTRPFGRPTETAQTGETLYYTQKGATVFAFIADPKPGASAVALPGLATDHACALGGVNARFERQGANLTVCLRDVPANAPAVAIAIG